MTALNSKIYEIEKADEKQYNGTLTDFDNIAKPLKSLGELENLVAKIKSIKGDLDIKKRAVVVLCADNGVIEEGVTQCDYTVTTQVVKNMLLKNTTVCNMGRIANADVFPYDVGMVDDVLGIDCRKLQNGTNNFTKTYAMTREMATTLINTGIEIVREKVEEGYQMLAVGEMGIGNTTTASAITAVLLGVDAKQVTSRGAGLSDEGVIKKINAINKGISLNKPNKTDVVDILSSVGGFDIACMCGVFLGCGIYKVPVIIDGFISTVASFLAYMLNENITSYFLPSHKSKEFAMNYLMEKMGLEPIINAKMALGEGTGAVTLMPILDMAIEVFTNMISFQEMKIDKYQPL